MNDYRIIFDFKGKEHTRIVNANDVNDAKTKFLSKVKETQPDYIPFDFWNYGYKITDLPEHLQQRYERYTHD